MTGCSGEEGSYKGSNKTKCQRHLGNIDGNWVQMPARTDAGMGADPGEAEPSQAASAVAAGRGVERSIKQEMCGMECDW